MNGVDPWAALRREWDAWQAEGRTATLWLRDDDATRSGPKLARLLDLMQGQQFGLAVIPALMDASLADMLAHRPTVRVLQHGWRHENHAGANAKKAEFGSDRRHEEMKAEIVAGWKKVSDCFPNQRIGIFVPPWNRIDPELAGTLPACGPALLSIYGARTLDQKESRLNTHVDIVDWHHDRHFVGEAAAVHAIVRHLTARRTGRDGIDPDEPTGILTHHRDHDPGCWNFLETLFGHIAAHPSARWIDPATQLDCDG